MPGIFGIISKGPEQKYIEELRRMQNILNKDNALSSDVYCDAEIGVYVGWYLNKNTFSDCLPIKNEKNDICLIYYGENFSNPSIFNELKSKNHKFDRNTASYLIHLYEDYGEEFLKQLNGLFVGLLIDNRNQKCFLFNDRYGMQRMYYNQSKDAFYFSTEAKGILKIKENLREFDYLGLFQHIEYGCALGNNTLFKQINTLPGGALWQFENFSIKKRNYFHPSEWEKLTLLEKDFFYDYLIGKITNALPNYLRSKNKIAILLEYGLESILKISKIRLAKEKYPCFSINYDLNDKNQDDNNNKIAESLSQINNPINIGKELLNQFPEFAQQTIYISDGNLSIARAHILYYQKIITEICPVSLSAAYGNVIFNDMRFPKEKNDEKIFIANDIEQYSADAKAAYNEIMDEHPITRALFIYSPRFEYNLLSLQQTVSSIRSFFHDNDLSMAMYRNYYYTNKHQLIGSRIEGDAFAEIATHIGRKSRSSKGDRQILTAKLYENWYRDELAGFIKSILLDNKTLTRSIFNKRGLEALVEAHINGRKDFSNEISCAIGLEYIHRIFFDDI
jgi:asparagine synthase (glutamine-hydrolysing)